MGDMNASAGGAPLTDIPLGVGTWNAAHLGKLCINQIKNLQRIASTYNTSEEKRKELKSLLNQAEAPDILLRWFLPGTISDDEPKLLGDYAVNHLIGPESIKNPEQVIKNSLATLVNRKRCNTLARLSVIESILKVFKENEWLHVLLLQEINQGVEHLKEAVESAGLLFCAGPTLKSSGRSVQTEYYPIVYRKDPYLTYQNSFFITTKGDVVKDLSYQWNKKAKKYRPVVVHKMTLAGKVIHFGVVHTTPGAGKGEYEFYRVSEYAQVVESLKKTENDGIWIIGGDFYLPPEARVIDIGDASDQLLKKSLGIEGHQLISRDELMKRYTSETEAMYNRLGKPFNQLPTKVTRPDLLRNPFSLTFERQIPNHLDLAVPVQGTNWHGKTLQKPIPTDPEQRARFYATARIADFFLYSNRHLSCMTVGMLRSDRGLALADTEELAFSKYFNRVSDHFPVAALFAFRGSAAAAREDRVKEILNVSDEHLNALDALTRRRSGIGGSGIELSALDFEPTYPAGYAGMMSDKTHPGKTAGSSAAQTKRPVTDLTGSTSTAKRPSKRARKGGAENPHRG